MMCHRPTQAIKSIKVY